MSIDLTQEPLISLAEAAGLFPPRRAGRKTHSSTIVRYITRGHRGVRLSAVRAGSSWCTSIAAVQRFLDELTAQELPAAAQPTAVDRRSRIDEQLAAKGLI